MTEEPRSREVSEPDYGRLVLAAVLIFVVLVGGTDAGRYLTPIRAITAAIGAGLIIRWLTRAPREADFVDKLLLAALLTFLAACVASQFLRQSFDAAVSATAFTAAAFVARRAVSDRRTMRFAIVVMGMMALVLSSVFLILWGLVWAKWISVTGQLPPLDVFLPVGPYRHFHVVGMTLALLSPALVVLAHQPGSRILATVGLLASAAVIVMSGSRTVWLAIAVVLLVVAGRAVVRQPGRVLAGRRGYFIGAGLAVGLIAMAMIGGSVFPRLLGTTTVALRGALWEASLHAWASDPLTGTGPGSFNSAITLSGFFAHYDTIGRHADNAFIQVLMEAGILGAGSVLLIVLALLTGLRERASLAAVSALALFALMSLTDNPSDSAHLVTIAIAWFAIATPVQDASKPQAVQGSWLRALTTAAAVVAALAVSATVVGAVAYDSAASAATRGDATAVRMSLRLAASFDPGSSLYRRNLAVWLLANHQASAARGEIDRAIALNPGDVTSLRVGALVAIALDQPAAAMSLATRAADLRTVDPANALTLAYAADAGGAQDSARNALLQALRWIPWLPADPQWHRTFTSDVGQLIQGARESWRTGRDTKGRESWTLAWLTGMTGEDLDPIDYTPGNAAVVAAISCDIQGAANAADGMSPAESDSGIGLIARILVRRLASDPSADVDALRILRPTLGLAASTAVRGSSPLVEPEEDDRLYSRTAISAPKFGPTFPTFASGLSAWLRDPRAAARLGAPRSGLATCQQ